MFSLRNTGHFMPKSDSSLAAASSQKGCSSVAYPGMNTCIILAWHRQVVTPSVQAVHGRCQVPCKTIFYSSHRQGSWCP